MVGVVDVILRRTLCDTLVVILVSVFFRTLPPTGVVTALCQSIDANTIYRQS